ncbi:F0F1 ATP synthase subunit A [Anoxybacter fermentans]|uniref:F0F1 ATP synthase subunit A n=1 Tax=Anoxybacter fermentans TaxID=1323375 RepID=UPI001F02C096|nr:F0F1 ATP synthase subunit A [Anoxybacter fermentans]
MLVSINNVPFITDTLVTAWVIVILLIIFAKVVTSNLKMIPGRLQMVAEVFVTTIIDFIDGLMPGEGRKYLPLIGTIFLFIGVSNLSGFIPFVNNPTADLNTTLGFALVVFVVSHYAGSKAQGVWNYLKGFAQPVPFLLPLNIISEMAKPVSHSFRLFGNILGGGIILGIAMKFIPWFLPVPLIAWFDLFVGVIQALIFTMLSIVYIAVAKDG